MTAPSHVGPLRLRARERLGLAIAGRHDAEGVCGAVSVRVDGELRGQLPVRPAYMRQQSFRLDTREQEGETHELELEVTGGSLACFDFWLE